ncbi:hypothetical protein [Glycomyces tarimensis]
MNQRELSTAELHTLFALVRIGGESTNRDVYELFGFRIESNVRNSLIEKGLITCRTDVKPYLHEATDAGWNAVRSQFGESAPERADRGTRVMYGLLSEIAAYMDKHHVEMVDLFGGEYVPAGGAEIEAAARAAYDQITDAPGAWVQLYRLREALPGVPREDLDRTLVEMHRLRQISLAPETNQKGLRDHHREAALHLGGTDHHMIAMGAGR